MRRFCVENSLHPGEVGAFPVDAPAPGASLDALVAAAHFLRQAFDHGFLRNVVEDGVALAATREGRDEALQLQRPDHFRKLRLALGGAHEVAALHLAPAQHAFVAREDGALLLERGAHDLVVFPVVRPERVEARHAQVARELSQVHVGDEARIAQGPRAQAHQRRDVERLEHRIHRDALAPGEEMRELHGASVDDHQVDLGVRHAEGLDRVLHRARAVDLDLEVALAPVLRQEGVHLLIEADLRTRSQNLCLTSAVVLPLGSVMMPLVAELKVIVTGAKWSLVRIGCLYAPPIDWPLARVHQFPEKTRGSGASYTAMYQVGLPVSSYMYPAILAAPFFHSIKKPRPSSYGFPHQPLSATFGCGGTVR